MDYNLFQKTLIVFSWFNLFSNSFSRVVFSEKMILLELKKSVSDSSGILSDWNPSSPDHCSWFGVSCNSKSRVVSVNIRGCDVPVGNYSPTSSSLPLLQGRRRDCSRSNGKLVGKISPSIGKLTQLGVLSLAFNDLNGEIPEEIWGLEKLEVLDLEGNNFTGKLSTKISGLRNLRVLNLGFNRLAGNIPSSLRKSSGLEVLNLAGNKLDGPIPGFFGDFGKLRRLDLSYNQLDGPTPAEIGRNCRCLKHLDLSGNYLILIGKVPNSLGRLIPVEALEGSRDSFLGHTPKTLWKLRKLASLNEEYEVSRDEAGSNSDGEAEAPPPPANKGLYPLEIASIVSASAIVSVLFVLVILFIYTRKWTRNSRVQVAESKEIRVFVDIGFPLTYENIVRATGNFGNGNCIGHGGFGSTYKAEISPNTLVAVKKLSIGRFQGIQQFHAEIMTLEMVRHSNLVTLIGYHASETEMFLIYNFLPGGNLENFIKGRPRAALEWKIIYKISLDVARVLAYLHDRCSPKVLHRDVKPSNILLDNDFNAYLSDFGLSKLLGSSQTHATTGVAGTFGYVAPEYAMTCRVSDKADVYSYGIVLLELISDKKTLDPSFSSHENGFNIASWAHMKLKQGKAKDVFTAGLWESGPQDDLVEILHLAVKCTVDSLTTRPMMKEVVQQLRQIKPS